MQWRMVEISGNSPRDFPMKCGAPIDAFHKKFREAMISKGVDIFRRDLSERKCIFYFPPDASALLLTEPAPTKAVPCGEPPDLASLRKLNFR